MAKEMRTTLFTFKGTNAQFGIWLAFIARVAPDFTVKMYAEELKKLEGKR